MIKIMYTSPPYAKLLHKKIASTLSIHPQNKTPCCSMTTLSLSKSYHEKEKDSPCPKKNRKKIGERWFMKRSSYTIHQKYPDTCTS
jgi:hypothetical protein